MIMKQLIRFFAPFAFAATFVGPSWADVSQLRGQVSVTGPAVTVADLFTEPGDSGNIVVARAPLPGKRVTLGIESIAAVLRRNEMTWRRVAPPARVTVRRESRTVPEAEIRDVIADNLRSGGAPERFALRFSGRVPTLHIGLNVVPEINVVTARFDKRTNRFDSIVSVSTPEQGTRKISMTGFIQELVRVPVLTETAGIGKRLTRSMVEWTEIQVAKLPGDALLDTQLIANMEARRTIRAGYPIRAGSVSKPALVKRGNLITILFRRPGLELATAARALDGGAKDDVIRVRNLSSKMVREVRIIGQDLAEASPTLNRTALR